MAGLETRLLTSFTHDGTANGQEMLETTFFRSSWSVGGRKFVTASRVRHTQKGWANMFIAHTHWQTGAITKYTADARVMKTRYSLSCPPTSRSAEVI